MHQCLSLSEEGYSLIRDHGASWWFGLATIEYCRCNWKGGEDTIIYLPSRSIHFVSYRKSWWEAQIHWWNHSRKLQTSCHAAIGVGVSLSILVSHVSPIILMLWNDTRCNIVYAHYCESSSIRIRKIPTAHGSLIQKWNGIRYSEGLLIWKLKPVAHHTFDATIVEWDQLVTDEHKNKIKNQSFKACKKKMVRCNGLFYNLLWGVLTKCTGSW